MTVLVGERGQVALGPADDAGRRPVLLPLVGDEGEPRSEQGGQVLAGGSQCGIESRRHAAPDGFFFTFTGAAATELGNLGADSDGESYSSPTAINDVSIAVGVAERHDAWIRTS